MMHIKTAPSLALATVLALAASMTEAAEPATAATPDFYSVLTTGKAHLEFRYRLESVDQDPFSRDATASTLRSRLNYQTGELRGFSALVEADNVTVIGDDDAYNSTVNGVTTRPVIADPGYTEVNQAYLQYKSEALRACSDASASRSTINASSATWAGARTSRPTTL